MRKRENYLEDGISAILPIYTEGVGDTTLLINLEGQKRIIHKKINLYSKALQPASPMTSWSSGGSMESY